MYIFFNCDLFLSFIQRSHQILIIEMYMHFFIVCILHNNHRISTTVSCFNNYCILYRLKANSTKHWLINSTKFKNHLYCTFMYVFCIKIHVSLSFLQVCIYIDLILYGHIVFLTVSNGYAKCTV
jgi:hypothetical protein